MTTKMRYLPGSFIEMDDLYGARKIVMVGRDGITFWDSMDNDLSAPLVLHPVFNPVYLGTTVEFVRQNGLQEGVKGVLSYLRENMPSKMDDALFTLRALWHLFQSRPADVPQGKIWPVSVEMVKAAVAGAEAQEALALRLHEQARNFYKNKLAA